MGCRLRPSLVHPSIACLFLFEAFQRAAARPGFVGLIPNGDKVPGSRTPMATGHINPQGHGTLNVFGVDFRAAGMKWTKELCLKDSDGDGRSNGEELGDPDCIWKRAKKGKSPPPARSEGITHPGIADAFDAPTT